MVTCSMFHRDSMILKIHCHGQIRAPFVLCIVQCSQLWHSFQLVSVKQQSEHQHSAHAAAICRHSSEYKTLSPLTCQRNYKGIFDRRLWLSHPPLLELNLSPPLSLASPGPCCASRPGCKGYGLRLRIAQIN